MSASAVSASSAEREVMDFARNECVREGQRYKDIVL